MHRVAYRIRQFLHALGAHPTPQDLAQAEATLGPSLYPLFRDLPPSDQAHALRVLHKARSSAPHDLELHQAALLHDAGKAPYPLSLADRAAIVLARRWIPARSAKWGSGQPHGWKRPFVVASQHPAWGATMVQQAGGSANLVRLIRDHQNPVPVREVDVQLACLQAADGES